MNRRFWSALLFLLICGAVGAMPFLRAAQNESPDSNTANNAAQQDSQQQDQQLDPPLPPLPDTHSHGQANTPPQSVPWGTSSQSTTEAQDDSSATEKNGAGQVLLHRNGRLFSGEIADRGDTYLIHLPYGEVELKKSEVEFVGANVAEVYRYRSSKVEPGAIDSHLELASWCASENLLAEAGQELSIAAGMAPQHPKIPLIARQIDLARSEIERREQDAETGASATEGPAVAAPYEQDAALARELPDGAVAAFTEQVQPLLLNSCATSGCHVQGSTASEFQIQRYSPSQGASQRLTQQNLRSALRYVNPDAVEQSELLTRAIAAHGGSRVAPINSTDSARFETLARWVVQVVGKPTTPTNPATQQQGIGTSQDPYEQAVRPLPQQRAVVRTSDEIRALLSGHSFVEQYDKRHPKEETVQFGLVGERPAADFPGLQPPPQEIAEKDRTNPETDAMSGAAPQSDLLAPADDVASRAAANGISADEQALLDTVAELPPNRIRVGAQDQRNHEELHQAELGHNAPRDPFDPAIFNQRYGTRPPLETNARPNTRQQDARHRDGSPQHATPNYPAAPQRDMPPARDGLAQRMRQFRAQQNAPAQQQQPQQQPQQRPPRVNR